MHQLIAEIAQATDSEIGELLKAVIHRYSELFPNWEICTLSLEKANDRNEQLDQAIHLLEALKVLP